MKLDFPRYSHSFRYHLQNRTLEEAVMKKLHLKYHPKFNLNAFQLTIKELLNDCRYVDAYK